MKPQHDFVAERPLARHCDALLPPATPERDLVAASHAMGCDMAQELAPYVASIAHGGRLAVICGESSRANTTAFINRLGRKAAHCVVNVADNSLLISLDHAATLALTDRAYGGTGDVPDDLPDSLPLSADLTLHQLQKNLCSGLAKIFADTAEPALSRRGHDLGQLDPFRGKAECVHFDLVVEQDGQDPWTMVVAASLPDMNRLIDVAASEPAHQQQPARAPASPLAEPFGDLPLPATAVLAEMQLPLARVSALKAGDIIPLSIARQVPLQIGGATVAQGTIGSQDDRVALQITRSF